ncbi:hypothetical protein L226DRAFT_351493 [Lentinus tigrinus ALCF2SS1-7]|uniref:uncharacterized protein n=1 Tax=Lentinus tigrinus ALCF2SS1-7 TaxID=1328758 RepID=UPI001166299C|nr:hypothetical protein L226DRAFT_351493 [Lentinus tigrinus ALCF2SS1-7]
MDNELSESRSKRLYLLRLILLLPAITSRALCLKTCARLTFVIHDYTTEVEVSYAFATTCLRIRRLPEGLWWLGIGTCRGSRELEGPRSITGSGRLFRTSQNDRSYIPPLYFRPVILGRSMNLPGLIFCSVCLCLCSPPLHHRPCVCTSRAAA